jgi:hypothetical protein
MHGHEVSSDFDNSVPLMNLEIICKCLLLPGIFLEHKTSPTMIRFSNPDPPLETQNQVAPTPRKKIHGFLSIFNKKTKLPIHSPPTRRHKNPRPLTPPADF